ncbi:MAG: hypothetical protein IJ496_10210 [Ruminococcus sp.]|nr:hypothetical protein [Ruminococcus sp.]
MNRMNIRIWLTASQRRTLGISCYMLLLIAGCAAGTICMLAGKLDRLCSLCLKLGLSISGEGPLLLSALRWNGGLLLLSFFLGFCAIGQPLTGLLLAVQGFSMGCLLTEMTHGMTGQMQLLQYLLTAAYELAVSFILLLSVRESTRLSRVYAGICTQGADAPEMSHRLRLYSLRYGVLLILMLAFTGIFLLLYSILL